MVSSRSLSRVFEDTVPLADLRRRLQTLLHGLRWAGGDGADLPHRSDGQPVFDVWIHEKETGRASQRRTFELSLDEIRRADIVIVLYNGEAGSAKQDDAIGICHAELQEAVARRGDVVYIVETLPTAAAKTPRDKRFQEYVGSLDLFRTQVRNEAELQDAILQLLHQAVAQLVKRGAAGSRRRDRGQALEWGRLDLAERQLSMRRALALELGVIESDNSPQAPVIALAGTTLRSRIDAIPDALTVAAARERVGQPFLQDHRAMAGNQNGPPGIVHVIACYRGVTARQASAMIGTPDAITVASDFGIYAADHVQQIQMFFLAQCADEAAVGVNVRRLEEWLQQTGEIRRVLQRAHGRAKILRTINEAMAFDADRVPFATTAGRGRKADR